MVAILTQALWWKSGGSPWFRGLKQQATSDETYSCLFLGIVVLLTIRIPYILIP